MGCNYSSMPTLQQMFDVDVKTYSWPNGNIALAHSYSCITPTNRPDIYPYGVSPLTPIQFRVPSLIFGPLVAKYLAENGVSGTLWKKILARLISYLAFTLMGWVSWPLYIFVFLASFSALWWPNIWSKIGFPELFEKTIGSIHYVPGIYLYGVGLLPPIRFVFLAPFSAPIFGSDQSGDILSSFMGTAC